MKTFIKPSLILTAFMLILISGYTAVVYGLGKVLPNNGEGEQIVVAGKRYYTNLAQQFKSSRYFHPRPSAVDYNAAGSGGSNKGPTNEEYLAEVKIRIDSLKLDNPEMGNAEVPVDLVTASASGLDPDISVAGANYQVKRIAKARNVDEDKIRQVIESTSTSPVLGPKKVNVLKLNIALDKLK